MVEPYPTLESRQSPRFLGIKERVLRHSEERCFRTVSDRFYRGDIADALEAWYIEKGGVVRKADLAAHKTPVVDPLPNTYLGYTVYKPGPLTQGPYLSVGEV